MGRTVRPSAGQPGHRPEVRTFHFREVLGAGGAPEGRRETDFESRPNIA